VIKRKSRDRALSQRVAAIAREARVVRAGEASVQARMRVPLELQTIFEKQNTGDRGQTWANGHLVSQKLPLLYQLLQKLSGSSVTHICDGAMTLVVGQESFTGDNQLEILLEAIAHYLPQESAIGEASAFNLEQRLTELDLLE